MKRILLGIACITLGLPANAQEISLEKIWSGYYRPQLIAGMSSMKDGRHFLSIEATGIVRRSYDHPTNAHLLVAGTFENYTLSQDESKILLETDAEPIYRHSKRAVYRVQDLKTARSLSLHQGKKIQSPLFSPDASRVAYVYQNDLYIQELATQRIVRVTHDGAENKIINGISDWVYEEEFGHSRQFAWEAGGRQLIWLRFDETDVPEVNLPIYAKGLYPTEMKFKYPKAGEKNSSLSTWVYDTQTKRTRQVNLDGVESYYQIRLFPTAKAGEMVLATANRHQNTLNLVKINTQTVAIRPLLTETDPAWIETDHLDLEFLPDNSFLWSSERDGHRHLYWYSEEGKLKKQLTRGDWEVTKYYGLGGRDIYFQSTQMGSTGRVVSSLNLDSGEIQIISDRGGTNSADFSSDFSRFIETHQSSTEPYRFQLKDKTGNLLRELENNQAVLAKVQKDAALKKEFFSINNAAGQPMNAWMIRPKDFDPSKKYPVLMYQYSGPGSQQVNDHWMNNDTLWFQHLAQQGYAVVCVDGRGTGFRGASFKKATYLQLGKLEIEDQISAARWLQTQPWVDGGRIGIFGWSFGGYMASLALTKGADVFKLGIAVAPVTNWRYYDTIYTERFLRTPQENPSGYDQNSPIHFTEMLKGKYLLIHGTADDNVHYQNAAEMANSLIEKNRPFDFMTYPDKNHGIYGGKTRLHLYTKMTEYILKNL